MKRTTLYPLSTWVTAALALPLALMVLGSIAAAMTSAETLAFDNQHLWWLGAAVPIAGLICVYGAHRKRRALNRFTSEPLAPLLAARVSPGRQALRAGLFVTATALIIAAIIGPRWGMYLEKQKVHGVDMVVALDVSRSMLAEDLTPNRFEFAKQRMREQLIDRAAFKRSNRLGLLAFAGSTSLRLPLTTDQLAFRAKLDDLRVGIVPRGGTDLGAAIERSVDLFSRSPQEGTRVVLLFTDGEDTLEAAGAGAAAAAWKDHGIRVFTVGVGDPSRTVGAQVPLQEGGARKPLLHDGQIVFSKVDTAALRDIADAGGGEYVPVESLHQLVDAVAGMHRADLGTEERVRRKPRYQWFLAAALILLTLETLIPEIRPAVSDAPQRAWQQELAVA